MAQAVFVENNSFEPGYLGKLAFMIPILSFYPPVIAHRGARSNAPENTLAAIRLAREQGAGWVEVDVKLTQDGIPILMHDETLERTTNGKGLVAEASWQDLRMLDAGTWFGAHFANERIPTLTETLHCVLDSGLRINLEIKPCPGRAQATTMVSLMETAKIWPEDVLPPLISSLNIECLQIADQLLPHWPRGLLFDEWDEDWLRLAEKAHADTIHLSEKILNSGRIKNLIRSERPILAYTVNDPHRANDLLSQGISAVFSDNPKEILAAL